VGPDAGKLPEIVTVGVPVTFIAQVFCFCRATTTVGVIESLGVRYLDA
jgi:hypothetical protein